MWIINLVWSSEIKDYKTSEYNILVGVHTATYIYIVYGSVNRSNTKYLPRNIPLWQSHFTISWRVLKIT